MLLQRKLLSDLDDAELLLFRALAAELELLQADIEEEAHVPKPDFTALAAATRDRRLIIEWLRKLNLPPIACYCAGPDLEAEELLLKESES